MYGKYISNCCKTIASPLRCTWSNEGFSKTIIFVENLLLRGLIFCLTLKSLLFVINCTYTLLVFVQQYNLHSPHHITFILQILTQSEHDVFPVHRLNLFGYNLIYVYEITSNHEIYLITQRFLTIKQIVHQYYSKILNIYIATLAKKIMLEALNSQFSQLSYIHQVSLFYINVKTKLVQTFVTLEKGFT